MRQVLATCVLGVVALGGLEARGQTLAEELVGRWAINTAERCASEAYQVSLSAGVLEFRDRNGKVTQERVLGATREAITAQKIEAGGAPGAIWEYRRTGPQAVTVRNVTAGRSFSILSCGEAVAQAPAPASQQGAGDVKVGFLAGTLETFDGRGGCNYILESDDRKRRPNDPNSPWRPVAANAGGEDIDDLVVNIEGRDMQAKAAGRPANGGPFLFDGSVAGYSVRIPNARFVSCGWECSKVVTRLDISRGTLRKSIPVVGYC